MAKEFELDGREVGRMLKGPEMKRMIADFASKTQRRAKMLSGTPGAEYGVDVRAGRFRVWGTVRASNWQAARDTLDDNTLLKAVPYER